MTVWVCGDNNGGLGLGFTTDVSNLTQVGSRKEWSYANGGGGYNPSGVPEVRSSIYFVKNNGTLWGCGANGYWQLAQGTTATQSSPVQIGSDRDWKAAVGSKSDRGGGGASGIVHALALKKNGTLWAWGDNRLGQLGLGDTTFRSSPVQIGSLTDWAYIATCQASSFGIKTDGTLWSWGGNSQGSLGLNDTTNRSSPVQVGSNTWKLITHGNANSIAIRSDGTIWGWGQNNFGQLGLGDTTQRNSPVQIGSDSNWKSAGVGAVTTGAIKTNGTLWTWGWNEAGPLGLGDTANRSLPVQVGALTDWDYLTNNGDQFLSAMKKDSTIWSWGNNSNGTLGLGDTTNRSSPTQVPGKWRKLENHRTGLIAFK